MPNELTGEFDVVAEVGLPGVNRVLAAQHQVTAPRQIYLHSFWARIPPGETSGPTGIRGVAAVQVSTPTVSLPAGSVSRVIVHFQVMARMKPYAGSVAVPEFIHGELRATVDIDRIVSTSEDVLTLDFSGDDVDIAFTPDPGAPLSAEDERLVNQALEHYLRTGFEPVNLSLTLPEGGEFPIRHWWFKMMSGGARPAVALLLNFRDERPTDADRAGVTNLFLEADDDFAIALSADFLVPVLKRRIREEFERSFGGRRYILRRPIINDCTYRIRLDEPEITLGAGRIEVTIRGRAPAPEFACPDYRFAIRQAFTLRPDGDTITLDPVGDLSVDLSGFGSLFIEGRLADEARRARSEIVRRARPAVREMLTGFEAFLAELRAPALRSEYRSVEIRPAGVVMHGRLTVAYWRAVMATYTTKTLPPDPPARPDPVLEMNAFDSWIPGGTVQRYRWIYGDPRAPVREIIEDHRFVTTAPSLIADPGCVWPPCQWCLELHGTRDGRDVIVSTCTIIGGGIVDVPWEVLEPGVRLPVGVTDARGDLVAHFDPGSTATGRSGAGRAAGSRSANHVVHFAGSDPDKTVPVVTDALAAARPQDSLVFMTAVVDPGAAGKPQPGNQAVPLAWAEDFEDGWRRTFEVQTLPTTFLINPQGKLVWQQSGPPDEAKLKAAFKEHLTEGESLYYQQLRPAIQPGEPAPDFLFDYHQGRQIALRTLQGRPVILNFWTSWSAPCLAELRRLQQLHHQAARQGLVILAINDGEAPEKAHKFFQQHNLSLRLVTDPAREIARQFGINCWPTTIAVDESGRIAGSQLGLTHQQQPRPPKDAA